MNDTYLQILEYLEPWGIGRQVEIESNLYEWFKHQINVDPNEPTDSVNARIEVFLKDLQDNKHVLHTKKKITIEGLPDKWEVQAHITNLGLHYLNEYRLNQSSINLNKSNIDLNKSIRLNIKIQLGIGFLTLAAIITTAVIAFMAYNKGDSENLILLRKSMQKQDQVLQQMQQLQKERNTYLKIMAKKDLPKKP